MNIRIDNPYGEDGEMMTLYADNKHVADVQIDGSNDCPDSLQDYLTEFGIQAHRIGIKETGYLANEPDFDNDSNIIWIVK